ncbi:hypothetical protein Ssi03_76310 [Sphaerisporangium siamense]|uniref:DNA-binding transcriptional MerR regulator n=1 Tax=Sphaerisporangium siamense TaxID=795645 RepID=A0A7W7D339_9ACTN|nr:helix-turn-helix domain-containing protein [Sphaerisporangium siamense]MBB4699312.1 DNA-binding transcriptional MerR regulator [Sphaerisporangium siamense]GII89641.1 hypothetical protein Ssi03_76310 [Sphaerisporangium siamense]
MTEEDLFTTAEAAAEVGFSIAAIDNWVRRGYLAPAGRRGRSNVYRLSDVFEVEKQRKHKHRRRT